MAGLFEKHEVNVTSDSEATIDSKTFADKVRSNVGEVSQHLSEVIGPVDPSEISVDQHGKVVIKNRLFAAAAKVAKESPLDNILCNHHLVCRR